MRVRLDFKASVGIYHGAWPRAAKLCIFFSRRQEGDLSPVRRLIVKQHLSLDRKQLGGRLVTCSAKRDECQDKSQTKRRA